ncbi:MAG: hypothetical protein U0234_22460 [Sandaracinus sp.]
MATFRPFARSFPVLGIAILVAPLAAGCELFVHFDRSKIDEGGDTGIDGGSDAGTPTDGGPDVGPHDAGGMDAFVPVDANVDANIPPDVGNDAFHFDTGGADAGCQGPSDCPATGNECVMATCDLGVCGTMNLGSSHIVATQTSGDCHIVVCDGAGGTTTINDDSDPPPATECEAFTCNAGSVVSNPEPTTTTCTTGGTVCDGAGNCVACNVPSDCPSLGGECVVSFCMTHTCGVTNLDSSHTLSTGQTPGDCQRLVCDGFGGVTSADDASDLPISSTACLVSPACTGTPLAPAFTPAATGTDCTADGMAPRHVCGDTTMASVAGTCVACNVDGDCTAGTCQADHTCM